MITLSPALPIVSKTESVIGGDVIAVNWTILYSNPWHAAPVVLPAAIMVRESPSARGGYVQSAIRQ
jgi:hypothetical protein